LGLVGEAGWYGELDRLAGISVLVPNSPTLYTLSGLPAHPYLLWRCPGLGTRAQTMPMRVPNCWSRPSHPVLSGTPPSPFALDRFPGSHSLGYPAGSDSPAIRRSILPNNRFVRWLSANSSQ